MGELLFVTFYYSNIWRRAMASNASMVVQILIKYIHIEYILYITLYSYNAILSCWSTSKRDNFNSWFMKKGNNTSKCHLCFSSGRNLPRKARRLLCNKSRFKVCSSSPRNGACWSPDTGRINQNRTNKGFLILNFLFFSKSLRKCLLNDSDINFPLSFF